MQDVVEQSRGLVGRFQRESTRQLGTNDGVACSPITTNGHVLAMTRFLRAPPANRRGTTGSAARSGPASVRGSTADRPTRSATCSTHAIAPERCFAAPCLEIGPGRSSRGARRGQVEDRRLQAERRRPAVDDQVDPTVEIGQHMLGPGRREPVRPIRARGRDRLARRVRSGRERPSPRERAPRRCPCPAVTRSGMIADRLRTSVSGPGQNRAASARPRRAIARRTRGPARSPRHERSAG